MTPVAADTSPERTEKYFELLRAAGTEGRIKILNAAYRGARVFLEAAIRNEFPGLSDEEVRVHLTTRFYGAVIARRLHGWAPGDQL